MSVTTQLRQDPAQVLRSQLHKMTPEFASALPSHIKPERFQRVVMTVVQQQPDLLNADRRSLLAACTKCAADGLIPDGREAALVIFNQKVKREGRETWVQSVQYMPMLVGVLKRARNSGEIAGIIVNVVHEADEFIQRPDDFERPIEHRPPKLGKPRGKPVGAYALVKLKDGTVQHEVMDISQIEQVRAVSRSAQAGPWVTFWDQMARKTVFRRLSKYLPMSAEADELMRRDDEAGAPTEEPVTIEGDMTMEAIESQPSEPPDAFEQAARGEVVEPPKVEPPKETKAAEKKPSGETAPQFLARLAKMSQDEVQRLDTNAAHKAWLRSLPDDDYKQVADAITDKAIARMGA